MANIRLIFKLSVPIILVTALALWLAISLSLATLERTLREVEESRLRFIASELRDSLQAGTGLGLAFAGSGKAQAIIDAAAREDVGIVSISVVDAHGVVVFNSGAVPATPFPPLAPADGGEWLARADSTTTFGARFAHAGGGVVVRYSAAPHKRQVAEVARTLALGGAAAVALVALCFVFGFQALLARTRRSIEAIEASVGERTIHPDADRHAADLVEQVNLTCKTAVHEVNAARQILACGEAAR